MQNMERIVTRRRGMAPWREVQRTRHRPGGAFIVCLVTALLAVLLATKFLG